MPDASLPPIWKSCGDPCALRTVITSIGTPFAAHTLLKLRPAAMTATSTSFSPGAGPSISSIRKASTGSPSRSERMVCAYMRFGTSPTGGREPTGTISTMKHNSGDGGCLLAAAQRAVAGIAPVQCLAQTLGGDEFAKLRLFRRVGGVERGGDVEIDIDGVAQPHRLIGAGERDLGHAQGDERGQRDFLRKRLHRRLQHIGGNDAVDQPDTLGFPGPDGVAGQKQFHGLLLT